MVLSCITWLTQNVYVFEVFIPPFTLSHSVFRITFIVSATRTCNCQKQGLITKLVWMTSLTILRSCGSESLTMFFPLKKRGHQLDESSSPLFRVLFTLQRHSSDHWTEWTWLHCLQPRGSQSGTGERRSRRHLLLSVCPGVNSLHGLWASVFVSKRKRKARPGGACLWRKHLGDGSWRIRSTRPDPATEVNLKPTWALLEPDSNKQTNKQKQ